MKFAKVKFIGTEPKMLKMLKELPIQEVDKASEADILFVGLNFLDQDIFDQMHTSVIPVLPADFGFIDYDPVREIGDAFNYDKKSAVSAIYALSRAVENHKFVYDWKSIQSNFNTRLQLSNKILV